VAAGYRRVETLALVLVQLVAVVDNGEIDLGPFRSVVRLVQLQPTLVQSGAVAREADPRNPPGSAFGTYRARTRGPRRCSGA